MSRPAPYLPALRFPALTALYDPLIARTTRERAFKTRLVELAAARPGERVLDLGCGTGTLALALKRAAPGASVSGVDGDEAMLTQGRAKAGAEGLDVALGQALAQELPFTDGAFDVVVSSLFFHHLERAGKEQAAAEMVRVLRPGGRVVIADWGRPRDLPMAIASLGIRLFDGHAPTRDNLAGRLPAILAGAGLSEVAERGSYRTVVGRLVIHTACR